MHLCIHSFSDWPFQFRWKTLCCARWKRMGFGYRSFLFRLPLSGTNFLLTSDTAILSHRSKLLLKHFFLLLPTPSYSANPLACIECCTFFVVVVDDDVFCLFLFCFVCLLLLLLLLLLLSEQNTCTKWPPTMTVQRRNSSKPLEEVGRI